VIGEKAIRGVLTRNRGRTIKVRAKSRFRKLAVFVAKLLSRDVFTIVGGCEARFFVEGGGKSTRRCIATIQCDIGDRQRMICKQFLGTF
jgi:hypothetical protein